MMIAALFSITGCDRDDPIEKNEKPIEEKTDKDSTEKESDKESTGKDTSGDSTGDESNTNTREKLTDSEAGAFQLTNITTGESLTETYHQCFVGDTLKAVFSPKQEYSSVSFDVTIDEFTKLNDSLFVVTDLKTGIIGQNIEIQAVYSQNDSTLSAKKIVSFFTWVEQADVTYSLKMSPSLLEFVNVSLEYTDEQGQVKSIKIGDNDWINATSVWYEYEGKNGEKKWTTEENPGDEWTKIGEEITNRTYYDLKMHYDKLDQTYIVRAKYTIKQYAQPHEDSYNLVHRLTWGPATVAGALTINTSIIIGDNTDIKRENLADYLEKLAATPDVLTLYLDKRKKGVTEMK